MPIAQMTFRRGPIVIVLGRWLWKGRTTCGMVRNSLSGYLVECDYAGEVPLQLGHHEKRTAN